MREGIMREVNIYPILKQLKESSIDFFNLTRDMTSNEPDRAETLHERFTYFRNELTDYGIDILTSTTPVVQTLCGDQQSTVKLANYCQQHGILVQAILPPTVSDGLCRLLISINLNQSYEELDYWIDIILQGAQKFNILPDDYLYCY